MRRRCRRSTAARGTPWPRPGGARRLFKLYAFLEAGRAFDSNLFRIARTLVRAPTNVRKKTATACVSSASRPALAEHAPAVEEADPQPARRADAGLFADQAARSAGPDHPIVKQVLGVESPEELARRVVQGSKLADVNLRKQLFDGGLRAWCRRRPTR